MQTLPYDHKKETMENTVQWAKIYNGKLKVFYQINHLGVWEYKAGK
jgi:hypothetical protein